MDLKRETQRTSTRGDNSRSTFVFTSPSMMDPITKGSTGQKYLLRWNHFGEQIRRAFAELYFTNDLADVTLALENGELIKAHKFVLALGSSFFRKAFENTPNKHPIVIINEVSPDTLRSVLEYIYLGTVKLKNEAEVKKFTAAVDYLGIDFGNLSPTSKALTSDSIKPTQQRKFVGKATPEEVTSTSSTRDVQSKRTPLDPPCIRFDNESGRWVGRNVISTETNRRLDKL